MDLTCGAHHMMCLVFCFWFLPDFFFFSRHLDPIGSPEESKTTTTNATESRCKKDARREACKALVTYEGCCVLDPKESKTTTTCDSMICHTPEK